MALPVVGISRSRCGAELLLGVIAMHWLLSVRISRLRLGIVSCHLGIITWSGLLHSWVKTRRRLLHSGIITCVGLLWELILWVMALLVSRVVSLAGGLSHGIRRGISLHLHLCCLTIRILNSRCSELVRILLKIFLWRAVPGRRLIYRGVLLFDDLRRGGILHCLQRVLRRDRLRSLFCRVHFKYVKYEIIVYV